MKYNKPEVTSLGDAVYIIQGQKDVSTVDGGNQTIQPPPPAYELDE